MDGWAQKMGKGQVAPVTWTSLLSPAGFANAHPVLTLKRFDYKALEGKSIVARPRQSRPGVGAGTSEQRAWFDYDLGPGGRMVDLFVLAPEGGVSGQIAG